MSMEFVSARGEVGRPNLRGWGGRVNESLARIRNNPSIGACPNVQVVQGVGTDCSLSLNTHRILLGHLPVTWCEAVCLPW